MSYAQGTSHLLLRRLNHSFGNCGLSVRRFDHVLDWLQSCFSFRALQNTRSKKQKFSSTADLGITHVPTDRNQDLGSFLFGQFEQAKDVGKGAVMSSEKHRMNSIG